MEEKYGDKCIKKLVIIKKDTSENERYYTEKYILDGSVQSNNIQEIIEFFEGERSIMKECHCHTFDADGYSLYKSFDDTKKLITIKNFPSPYISFSIDFCDRKTGEYTFSVITDINSNVVTYVVDKSEIITKK